MIKIFRQFEKNLAVAEKIFNDEKTVPLSIERP